MYQYKCKWFNILGFSFDIKLVFPIFCLFVYRKSFNGKGLKEAEFAYFCKYLLNV